MAAASPTAARATVAATGGKAAVGGTAAAVGIRPLDVPPETTGDRAAAGGIVEDKQ